MLKAFITFTLVLFFLGGNAQVETTPTDFNSPKKYEEKTLGGLDDKGHKAFNNIDHPLSITGGGLTVLGEVLYVIASERLGKQPIDDPFLKSYSPQTSLHYIGIGVFATGAILFAIFSTERDVNVPKRKKKKSYNAADWEIVSE